MKSGGKGEDDENEGEGPSLSISPEYLAHLTLVIRGLQAREEEVDPDEGSNAIDDNMIDALQDTKGDLSRREVIKELQGLNERQQAELVALMWIGRGDAEPEEWEETIELARQFRAGPTPAYLMRQPLVAEHWEEGAARLGLDLPLAPD
ncbi:MAG: DUF3775 domain-containing protein [Hyphomicrobiaceae bacterium]|nr:MAG: DUF3775 domain-containing protein [Hyphomicrobiaceae bacterium]